MLKNHRRLLSFVFLLAIAVVALGCDIGSSAAQPQADSGVSKAHVTVPTQANGLTTEQDNVKRRLLEDNQPGAIKHLYIISAYSGQVLLYSTVKGKVTSSGKRLSPTSVTISGGHEMRDRYGYPVAGDAPRETSEVLQDDGTYGSSVEYIYWWDAGSGAYHQHYVSGGQIVHVSSQPLAVKNVVINVSNEPMETAKPIEVPVQVKAVR